MMLALRECVWLKPEAVAQIGVLRVTGVDHFRHTKFVPLRDDKASDGRQGNIGGRSSNRSVNSPEAQIADVF
jgi:ATP-dependent DNA ligase